MKWVIKDKNTFDESQPVGIEWFLFGDEDLEFKHIGRLPLSDFKQFYDDYEIIPFSESPASDGFVSEGVKLIEEERRRQVFIEGWSEVHDEDHDNGELANAAACYALAPTYSKIIRIGSQTPKHWPWDYKWWKPSPGNRIRELQKAGALIAAEIDRLKATTQTP